jgi:phospholipase C
MFDEWGGFFDHVVPPRVVSPQNSPDKDLQNGAALLGFRVPTVIASPFTRGVDGQSNFVDHTLYDHTAALKLIEWRFGLKPLTARDASSAIGNPAASFNFTSPNPALPLLPSASKVFAPPCFGGGIFSADTAKVADTPAATTTKLGTKSNEFTPLANSPLVTEFMNHPHIQSLAKE